MTMWGNFQLTITLNDNDIKTASGKSFTKHSVRTVLQDAFYINLVKKRIDGKTRYVFEKYESLVSVEEWVMAQVILKNFELLQHPDIQRHIVNLDYDQDEINFEYENNTDYHQYMRDKEREELTI
ncbi:recombinase family protein [Aquibacillus salsiterrae]|uniref:Recombinase family protein n=1 Tax=Aquibacillus salsiterrae TaxID=2950439 RepID=A0A9X4AGA6_9BACI|nr:recombinase family protein [Aquibacillus salsiterrae]MDC3418479.1 recombinase family protein [Aquibacillus salsiterrae]